MLTAGGVLSRLVWLLVSGQRVTLNGNLSHEAVTLAHPRTVGFGSSIRMGSGTNIKAARVPSLAALTQNLNRSYVGLV